jgi:F-type H+-transporting ATPase subunit b
MAPALDNATVTVLAAAKEAGGGNFLVTPGLGLMVWTLIAFGITFLLLRKLAFPRIQEALEKRQHAIEDSIDHAERTRKEADEILAEYRERLKEARKQSEDIVTRARKAAEMVEREATESGKLKQQELLEQARRDIQAETRKSLQDIRREVAELTVMATEKVTRKTLTQDDQRKLVEDALSELDFSALSGTEGR